MTSITLQPSRAGISLDTLRQASPLLWRTSIAFLALFALAAILSQIDPRLFNGISVWIKPAKFFLSLAVHMLTVSWALTLLPDAVRAGPVTRGAIGVLVAMAIFEMAYIALQAARGEASHFNSSSVMAQMIYTAMGIGAVLIMVSTAIIGLQILRSGPRTLLARSFGVSFILAALLTVWVGLTLGGMGSHWIGGDQTDATGLPLVGWSTTGGDLRPAHFMGLHIMQAMPLVALAGSRALVAITGVVVLVATIAAYALALSGIPLISF